MPIQWTVRSLKTLWTDQRFRFLAVGGANTLSGYIVSVICWWSITRVVHEAAASTIAMMTNVTISTIVNVTISYITQKLLVFRTRGSVLAEYLKYYAINAVPIGISYALFPALVKFLHVNPYLAMALITGLSVIVSYVGHSRITFKGKSREKRGFEAIAAADKAQYSCDRQDAERPR